MTAKSSKRKTSWTHLVNPGDFFILDCNLTMSWLGLLRSVGPSYISEAARLHSHSVPACREAQNVVRLAKVHRLHSMPMRCAWREGAEGLESMQVALAHM